MPQAHSTFTRGAVHPRPRPNHAQSHPGVSPLNAITHRNTSFQPLPRALGLPPYHYSPESLELWVEPL
jgi:hypothetical protein